MAAPVLIAVDWGTSSCRAALLAHDGTVLDTRDGGKGILAIENCAFEPALQAFLAPWISGQPTCPVILSGMIGSRQGWREALYVRCPASLSDVARDLAWIDTAAFGRIAIVPGLDDHACGTPDVMRGEEVQIFGALGSASGHCVLPGTHSKWARVEAGRIVGFRSYMTGEVFAALKDHTIRGRLMTSSSALDVKAFERGVRDSARAGGPGALLNRMFATRTLGLFDALPSGSLADYLSGLLIGAEIADNLDAVGAKPVTIIGGAALTARYVAACALLGVRVTAARGHSAARGAFAVARAAGLLGERP
jgi:2-dehydro-3-deoxygalactonokinase